MKGFQVLVVLTVLTVVGCSSDSDTPDSIGLNDQNSLAIETLNLTVTRGQLSEGVLSIVDRPLEADIRLQFQLIPGNLFGSVQKELLIDQPVDSTNKATVVFETNIFTDSSMPENLNADAVRDGWIVDPADTRFGRLGAFAKDSFGNSIPTEGYVLYDEASDRVFTIAYFDQAASLTASYTTDDGVIEVNAQVPGSGFYALGSFETVNTDGTPVREWISVAVPNDALFAILE